MAYKFSLCQARKYAGFTQAEMAAKIGTTRETWINWETGKTEISVSALRKLSETTGIAENDIFLPVMSTKVD
jgi:transcriptional regulator with XRE-family HTH domain